MKQVDVAIIGAGSGGLSAWHEIKKVTPNVVMINDGLHGTTCARVGCMPSKVLIQVANDFHRRGVFLSEGIHGGDDLTVNRVEALAFVRKLRDRFVASVMSTIEEIGERNITGRAEFLEPIATMAAGFAEVPKRLRKPLGPEAPATDRLRLQACRPQSSLEPRHFI